MNVASTITGVCTLNVHVFLAEASLPKCYALVVLRMCIPSRAEPMLPVYAEPMLPVNANSTELYVLTLGFLMSGYC